MASLLAQESSGNQLALTVFAMLFDAVDLMVMQRESTMVFSPLAAESNLTS
jgi:hypothetical protein